MTLSARGTRSLAVCLASLCAVQAGCSFAPPLELPVVPTPAQFKEAGAWTVGTPEDQMSKGSWWNVYSDPVLDDLEGRFERKNPSFEAAIARFDQSRAYLAESRSSLFPALNIGGRDTRNRQSDDRPLRGANQPDVYDDRLLGASVDYEFDLWGRVRLAVDSGRELSKAFAADAESLRLSLQGALASDYFELRGLDSQAALLRDTIEVYRRALDLTDDRHGQGIASGLDVEQARTQLSNAQAQLADVTAARALFEHAIAALAGESASTFSITPAIAELKVPNVPTGLPATLLQRRPDIAAAQRRVAAANARIGVARAAFFPNLSLSALVGFEDTTKPNLLAAPNLFWTLGPQAVVNVFDAGRRKALVAVATAQYRETAANYRERVLQAFQDVEDNLSLLNDLAQEAAAKAAAVESSTHAQKLAWALYQYGAAGYLDVETAQTAALQAKLAEASVQSRRLVASVRLIRAIGGGWETPAMLGSGR